MRIQALIESNYFAKFNIHVVNSFQRNNRKALKPLLQNLAGHSGSLIPEDPPRIRRALVQATADPGTLARASTSEGAEARRPPRLSSRPERSDNSPTCSATEADRLAEPTGLLREAGAPGGRGWCRAPGSAPPPLSNRPRRRAGWEKRRRPASWLRWGTRAAGGGCRGGCGATPALPEGSGGLDKPVSERGLGLPRAPGAAVCRGREAQQQRRPRRGGQRPHLAPAGGAELGGPTGAPAVGRNRDPKTSLAYSSKHTWGMHPCCYPLFIAEATETEKVWTPVPNYALGIWMGQVQGSPRSGMSVQNSPELNSSLTSQRPTSSMSC
nr:translation initiation factor IF-2-like [Equus asinus]